MKHFSKQNLRWAFAMTVLIAASPLPAQTSGLVKQQLLDVGSRKPAPDFALADIYGKTIELSKFKGRVVLLDFWAINCGGCKVELPWYVEFNNRYRSHGLSLIGLDMYGESPDLVRPFTKKWKMDYPVAIGTDAIGDKFGLKEMPLTLLIDRKGRIALSHSGIVDRNAFEKDLQVLLNE